jgi:quercetin dioxygenase-like cupin family protein
MRAAIVILAVLLTLPLAVRAESPAMELVAGPDAVKWGPVPPSFPKGAMIAVLAGNPFKEGQYVVRLKMPATYQLPAHHHPTTENVTVISGSFHAGMGDKLDVDKGQSFAPGGFVSMPAGMNHYAWATSETVVQVHGNGPFAIVYVNPADDPSKNP